MAGKQGPVEGRREQNGEESGQGTYCVSMKLWKKLNIKDDAS